MRFVLTAFALRDRRLATIANCLVLRAIAQDGNRKEGYMHMSIVRQLSVACVAAAALTASANAGADYHAYIHSANTVYGTADNGGAAIIRADILHQTCNTFVHDFVTHEMWYMTDSSNNYWVEVGVYDGEGTNAITNPCENDRIFWADSRPNGGGLNVHWFTNPWSFDTYYQASVTTAGNCNWNVVFGGLALPVHRPPIVRARAGTSMPELRRRIRVPAASRVSRLGGRHKIVLETGPRRARASRGKAGARCG